MKRKRNINRTERYLLEYSGFYGNVHDPEKKKSISDLDFRVSNETRRSIALNKLQEVSILLFINESQRTLHGSKYRLNSPDSPEFEQTFLKIKRMVRHSLRYTSSLMEILGFPFEPAIWTLWSQNFVPGKTDSILHVKGSLYIGLLQRRFIRTRSRIAYDVMIRFL